MAIQQRTRCVHCTVQRVHKNGERDWGKKRTTTPTDANEKSLRQKANKYSESYMDEQENRTSPARTQAHVRSFFPTFPL